MTRYRGAHRASGASRVGRSIAALALIGSSSVAGVMLLPASPAAAQPPNSAAWWNAANLGDPLPAPPAPPDVKSGDLYVEGSNAGPLSSILGNAPPTTQAIAGVAFDLRPGSAVGPLTLQIDGTAPPQISVTACKTTESFTSDENGPWSQVPTYDANGCVSSALKGTSVVFPDVSKLATQSTLSVLILPGPLDRVVFKAPGAGALEVASGGHVGSSAPPVGTGAGSTASSQGSRRGAGAGRPATGSVNAGSAGGPTLPVADLPAGGTTTKPGNVVPPVVAAPGTTPTAAQPAAATGGMSTKERRLIGLLIIAVEVVGYLLLRRWPAREAAPVAGAVAAGGRLRPPDRPVSDVRTPVASGGGRFRRERQGPVPHL